MGKCQHCGQDAQGKAGGGGAQSLAPHARVDGAACAGGDASTRRVHRWDAGELGPPQPMPNGWMRVQGRIARTGIQEYAGPKGEMVRELRLPEEVFDAASMASFRGVPLTNTHPPVLLDDKNAKFYSVGSVGEIRRDGDWLSAELLITEAEARRDAESGRSELSNGYECDLDPTQHADLVAKWGPYDSIQRNIRGNHCALVDEARAGHEARARMDAQSGLMVASTHVKQGASAMGHVTIDGLRLEVNDANVGAIQQAIEKALGDVRASVAGLEKRADGAERKAGKAFGLFDSLMTVVRRGKKRRDAMKARMVPCDECGGTGEVKADDESAAQKCDYCDGKGEFRMHDQYADLSSAKSLEPESEEHGEAGGDPTDDDDDMDDADELAVERETEETGAAASGAAKAKKDSIDTRRKARRDSRRDSGRKLAEKARKSRADSMARRIDRAVRSRTKLVAVAEKYCGEGFKADGKSDLDLRKAVILAAWPEAKLDGKSPDYLRARFDVACEELAGAPSATDRARAAAGGGTGGHVDGAGSLDPDKARQAMIKKLDNVHAVKAGK